MEEQPKEKKSYNNGNQFWKARSSHGRKPLWANPDDLRDACYQWFQWVEDNPLTEHKVTQFQGAEVLMAIPKLRAMTLAGLCIYLGMTQVTWREYGKKDDFSSVVDEVEQVIYNQKFVGASADLLNANIISRDLGLSDKQDHVSSDSSMTPKAAVVIAKDVQDILDNL